MALPNGIQSNQELLDAQAHVWNHIFSFINSMSLKCAIQLGIPDIIHKHGKPITLPELIDALPINKAKSLYIQHLMRILIHSNFFTMAKISENGDDQGYWLTPAAHLLLRGEQLSMTSFALAVLDPIFMDPWHHMSQWFKNNDPTPFATTHGTTIWEAAAKDPQLNQSFNEAMATDARLVMSVIVKDFRQVFDGLRSMVDVGGGTGTAATAFANAFTGLNCTVLDLPHVVAGLEGTNNLSFIGGNMFEAIPPADAVFMKWILHDWPDEECIKILKKCKEAIPSNDKGGKIVIVDMVVDNQKNHEATETQLLIDMEVIMLNSGRERTTEDWVKLFSDAGFTSYKITPLLGLRSLIESFPFLVPRRAIQETDFIRYQIPKTPNFFVNAWVIGRDPECWNDPLSFKHERFLGSKIDYGLQNLELIPFGAGQRICAGIPLAHRMLQLVLGSLLHEFDWSVGEIGKNAIIDTRERMGAPENLHPDSAGLPDASPCLGIFAA